MLDKVFIYSVIFQWILPFSLMIGAYILFTKYYYFFYDRLDVERIWKSMIKIGIVLGLVAIGWYLLVNADWFVKLTGLTKQGANWISQTDEAKKAFVTSHAWWQRALQFVMIWFPIYFRAFVVVFVISTFIFVQSLVWRIEFIRSADIIISTAILFPYLSLKYLIDFQTPFFDFVQSRLFIAKLKENINDSYFNAIIGRDEYGNKFDSGAGGTAQIHRIKATAIAVKRTRARVKTAGGIRKAELITKNSRETDTDKVIELALKGFGKRLIAPSIRFQDDPILNVARGGYIFDSDVSYNTGDTLGTWQSIFFNPFSKDIKFKNGGDGAIRAILAIYEELFKFVIHFTPPAIYERIVDREARLYTPDRTADRAKYKAQQNLDLSVLSAPLDSETGNDRETQIEKARKVATERISDVTNALNTFKINGTFHRVLVGGNSAIYEYTLTRTADLPSDFKRVQEGLSQLLRIKDLPIIGVSAGVLSVSMTNGVNIPVDFRDMINTRNKGMKTLMTGIAGVDALGKNIYVELDDTVPHMMLFGATGRGKTVTIMTILYSIMSAVTPDLVRIAYIDGKGNSFEFMRTDNKDSESYHPNPYTYAQPADGSGDIEYARALIKHFERETRRRIDLFKTRGAVSKLAEFNKKYPDEALPEILVVCDEFSAITDLDSQLKADELSRFGTVDTFEYLAKMSRSAGIHLMLANQTARKEKVPGKISANIGGRLSLGVTEPIESDIALPDSNIPVHLIQQAGEFYSTLHGIRNAEHGNSPYLTPDDMNALNGTLERKFGHRDYVVTRDEVMRDIYGDEAMKKDAVSYDIPNPMPDKETPIDELLFFVGNYPDWALANKDNAVFTKNKALNADSPIERKKNKNRLKEALEVAEFGKKKKVL